MPDTEIVEHTHRARLVTLRTLVIAGAAGVTIAGPRAFGGPAPVNPYVPLQRYEGAWRVMPDGKTKPDRLVNDCARVGRFFACQQTVNGKPGPLLIFIPDSAGHYHTQVVRGDGAALGPPGTLTLSDDHWVYLSKPDSKGVRYRTVNDFQGPDRIHFVVAHSSDGKRWVVTLSGVEERVR